MSEVNSKPNVSKKRPANLRHIWHGMKSRCLNPNHDKYKNYGGRGIAICERWLNSYEAFVADMGPRPSPKHTIDRYPNNDGNYEAGNCRWATRQQQMRNTSKNHRLTHDGRTLTIAEWSEATGIPHAVLSKRVMYSRWSDSEAIITPLQIQQSLAQREAVECEQFAFAPEEERAIAEYVELRRINRSEWFAKTIMTVQVTMPGDSLLDAAKAAMLKEAERWLAKRARKLKQSDV